MQVVLGDQPEELSWNHWLPEPLASGFCVHFAFSPFSIGFRMSFPRPPELFCPNLVIRNGSSTFIVCDHLWLSLIVVARSFCVRPLLCRPRWITLPTSRVTLS